MLEDVKNNPAKDHPHLRALFFLWYYLNLSIQPILLIRKKSRKEILERLGIENEGYLNISEQDFVNKILIGEAQTINTVIPNLRNLVKEELREGLLKDTYLEAKRWGVPDRAVYASANAFHCSSLEELPKDIRWLSPENINLFLQEITQPIQPQAPPTIKSEKILSTNLNSFYEPQGLKSSYSLNEIKSTLREKTKELLKGEISCFHKYLLLKRSNWLINQITEASTSQNYTFFHALIAISHFLIMVAKELVERDEKDQRLNIYIARDSANFWLARRVIEGDKFNNGNNIIFHLSRSQLGPAHKRFSEIISESLKEAKDKDELWRIILKKFKGEVRSNKEFAQIVKDIEEGLKNANILNAKKIRIIESLSEGIVIGFLKAVILNYNKEIDVEEFVVSPKSEQVKSSKRGITTINWIERLGINEEERRNRINQWFKNWGVNPPGVVSFQETEILNEQELMWPSVEALVYHLFYPYSEVNLGHPIEFDSQNKVLYKTSPAKNLGKLLREILLINAKYIEEEANLTGQNSEGDQEIVDLFRIGEDLKREAREMFGLTEKEFELFDRIIDLHNEVFTTENDKKQFDLLLKLSIWIKRMGTTQVERIIERIEKDINYRFGFERFLFEMRQFSVQDFKDYFVFYILGRENLTKNDFLKDPTPFSNELRQIREEGLVIKKVSLAGEQRRGLPIISPTYGEAKPTEEGREEVVIKIDRSNLVDKILDGSTFSKIVKFKSKNKISSKVSSSEYEDYLYVFYPVFVNEEKEELSFKNLVDRLGHEDAEKILKTYVEVILEEFKQQEGIIKVNKFYSKEEEIEIIGLRGSILLVLSKSQPVPFILGKFLDEISEKFSHKSDKYQVKTNLIRVKTPTLASEIENLYVN
ncbi:MAG: hypothetical protein J7K26_02735, partial [Candidatus Aenigmarchaeota archaeon]|nr:hypothetical protein [Candidatus Aenigmarchaeota archaeon]